MTEIAIGKFNEFPDGDHRIVALGLLEVGVFRRGERLLAYENRCPHFGGPVCQGKIFNRVVEDVGPEGMSLGFSFSNDEQIVCPWHGYEFNIETGLHPGDSTVGLTPVSVRITDGVVYLEMPG